MTAPRPRRALLFCPGTEPRKIQKASQLQVDSVIIDLEDAAALTRKAEARVTTAECLAQLEFAHAERLVRINPVGGPHWADDLAVTGAAECLPDGFVLPKVESPDAVREVAQKVAALEAAAGRAPGAVAIIAIIETARGVVNLAQIANADPRLQALIFGAEDLCGDIGAQRTAQGFEVLYARSAVVIHCAAAEIQAIDTPFVDLTDDEGLRKDTEQAVTMGYTGKLAIHPKQVAPIAEAFTPSEAELAAARRLVDAHDKHQAEGRGVFALDGRMVDMPMVRAAKRVLNRAGKA